MSELGQYEKGQLRKAQGAFHHVFQYARSITESLKSQGIEIREASYLDPTPDFMPLTAVIVWGENLDVDSALSQLFAEAENKYPC